MSWNSPECRVRPLFLSSPTFTLRLINGCRVPPHPDAVSQRKEPERCRKECTEMAGKLQKKNQELQRHLEKACRQLQHSVQEHRSTVQRLKGTARSRHTSATLRASADAGPVGYRRARKQITGDDGATPAAARRSQEGQRRRRVRTGVSSALPSMGYLGITSGFCPTGVVITSRGRSEAWSR